MMHHTFEMQHEFITYTLVKSHLASMTPAERQRALVARLKAIANG